MILNSLVISFWNLTKIIVLLFVIVFALVGIIAMIESTINNFRNRKLKKQALAELDKMFDDLIENLQKQQEEEKKKTKKPRTKKVDKKEE